MIAKECMKAMGVLGLTTLPAIYLYKQSLVQTKKERSVGHTTSRSSVKDYDDYDEHTLVIHNEDPHWDHVLRYLYHQNSPRIKEFTYEEMKPYTYTDWNRRGVSKRDQSGGMKILKPTECAFAFVHEFEDTDYQIEVDITSMRDVKGDRIKILQSAGHSPSYEVILQRLTLKSSNERVLTNYVDEAKEFVEDELKNAKVTGNDTMDIYYWKKDYWVLLSKIPKRRKDTIYLKKGQKETISDTVQDFFSEETRNVYLEFGIPYKSVCLIHGPPGTGKTSTIKSIASELDCDLYVIPISKDMLDTHLIEAFTNIDDDQAGKERVIVIEDVDTMFDERKEGDNLNGITLQGFLNCLDGFTCVDGTMMFITANKPEVLDSAILRSCRIDHKFKLGYADKYQTEQMFTRFFPDQTDDFSTFYQSISHKDYTTAMLQEFFFYNRKCEKIVEKISEFTEIVTQNDPKHFEVLENGSKHCYM